MPLCGLAGRSVSAGAAGLGLRMSCNAYRASRPALTCAEAANRAASTPHRLPWRGQGGRLDGLPCLVLDDGLHPVVELLRLIK